MISVVLIASEDLPGLAAQMSMLVPAAVDGLVKEVVLVAGDEPGVEALAEDSGARLVRETGAAKERLAAGARAARGDWVLTLRSGPVLREGWREPVERHLAGGAGAPARLIAPGGLLGRLAPKMHGVLLRRLDWPSGVVADENGLARATKAKAITY
ncbi:cell wall biosynthesis glycosyltransferase [Caulobacter vibrioides]|uniref:Cell wall biosynthesis glycosyltransferase n=1 Tax=Caulobacter vibrioides TaxID=155892 RepID=A0A290MJ93_CAUVI|nr:cell wall biosynthesis glycosyltransferase [Caulobacter vibrioides]ATC32076.1 cell wall biosynthesis glycosyltransferase [Caulobacter vibrioides]